LSVAAPLSASLAGTTSGDLPVPRSHKPAEALAWLACLFKYGCLDMNEPAAGFIIEASVFAGFSVNYAGALLYAIQRTAIVSEYHAYGTPAQVEGGVPCAGVSIDNRPRRARAGAARKRAAAPSPSLGVGGKKAATHSPHGTWWGCLALSNTPSAIALGGQTGALMAALC